MKLSKLKFLNNLLLKNKIFPFNFFNRSQKKIHPFFFKLFSRNVHLLFVLKSLSKALSPALIFQHVNLSQNFLKLFSSSIGDSFISKWKPGFLTNGAIEKQKKSLSFVFYNQSTKDFVGMREAKKQNLFYVSFQSMSLTFIKKNRGYTLFYNAEHLRALWFSKNIITSLFK